MKNENKERRNILGNSRFQFLFIIYIFFSMVVAIAAMGYDYLSIVVPVFISRAGEFHLSLTVKSVLLAGWIIITYLISYLYFTARVMGAFKRIGDVCERISRGERGDLKFRSGDSFRTASDTFNRLVESIGERDEKLSCALHALKDKLMKLLSCKDSMKKDLTEIIEDLDKLKANETTFQEKDSPPCL